MDAVSSFKYADRSEYINYIVNCLIEEVDRDTHQFQHPDQLTKILLDIIEENYLYKVEHQCCPLSNIFEIISYEYQLQYSMYYHFVFEIYFFLK